MEKEKLKKGFTLIELLAVIIILSLLLFGGGYLIVNYIQDAKNKAKDVSMNNIFKSAELYTKELYTGDFSIRWIPSSEVNDDEVSSGDTATITKTAYSCVTVKMLIDEGYLTKKTIKENDLNENDIIKLTKDLNSNKIINKEYISKEEYSNFNDVCPGYGDITKPDIDVTVEKGITYEKEKEATITISDSEGGFKAGTYKIKYGWSTQQLSCADMTDSVNIKVKQGDKEKNTKVTISGQNGAGKIYVCNESALIDVSGNTLSSGYTINNDMRLDNTGPEIIFSPNGNEIISKSQSTKITVKDKYDGKENNLKYKWSTTNTTDASDGQTFTNESSLSKINDTGRYYLCVYAEDSLGNKTNKCSNSFAVDNAKPSIPTYNAFFASDKSTYNQGTWTDKQVHTTISTTYSGIGTIYMQYILTTDYEKGKDWSNFNFSAGALSKNGTTYTGTEPWGLTERNQSYYFRACVKETEICSDISSKYTIMYDLTSPSSSNGGLTYTAYHPTDGNKEYKSGDLTNKLVYTKITAKDDRSGISKIQYISKSSFNASNPNNGWRDFGFGISKLTQNGTSWTGTEEWSLSDRNDKYYIRACDKLNHCPTSISDFVEFNIYYDITGANISLSQTSNTTVTAILTENNGVAGYYWTSTKQSNTNSINWISSSNKTLALEFYGSKPYYLYIKDIAGNISDKTITTNEVSSDISISINKSKNSYGWYLEVPTITIKTTNPKVGNYYNYTITGSKNTSKNNIASSSTTTISDLTNGTYQLCVTSYNSEGKDEKKKCEDIKIDTTNPSTPTISLSGNTITISSSDSNVTYKYSTNGGSSYTTGSSFTLTSTTTIKAKAVEISGRESSVNTKTLTVNNATNITPNTKYQCSSNGSYYDNSDAAKSACSYTGTTYYQCTFGGTTTTNTNYNTVKNACTATGKRCLKCDYDSQYIWSFHPDSDDLSCHHTIETSEYYNNNPDVTAPSKDSDCNDHDMSIGGCFKITTSYNVWGGGDFDYAVFFIKTINYACTNTDISNPCITGFTRQNGSTAATCYNYYSATEQKCYKECKANCSKTVSNNSTYVKYIYLDGVKDNNNASSNNSLKCSEMNYDYRTNTSTRTNTVSTKYSCTGSSSNLQDSSTCYHSTSTKYYCSHTNSYYSTLTQAQSACSNICNSGSLYNGKCYKLS